MSAHVNFFPTSFPVPFSLIIFSNLLRNFSRTDFFISAFNCSIFSSLVSLYNGPHANDWETKAAVVTYNVSLLVHCIQGMSND